MKKILFVNPTSARGGGLSMAIRLGLTLKERWDVSMFFPYSGEPVKYLDKQGFALFFGDNGSELSTILALQKLLRKQNFDIIHAHGTRAAVWVKLAFLAGAPRRPFVYTLHGIHFLRKSPLYRFFFVLFERLTSGMVSALVAVSQEDRMAVERYHIVPPKRIFLVKNGIDVMLFASGSRKRMRMELGIDKMFVIATVCRLVFPKDVKTIIRAVHALGLDSVRFVVVGDGPDRAKLELLNKNFGDRTIFLGDRKDIADILAAADVFVLSSRWEGMPVTILEAMAAGKPVIGSDSPGIREIVKDGENGFLFSFGDPLSLAQKIIFLKDNPEIAKEFSMIGKNIVRDTFTEKTMASAYENIYFTCEFSK